MPGTASSSIATISLRQRTRAFQMAELGEPHAQAEGQEHHLRHGLGGGIGGHGGRRISAGFMRFEHHQPRRRDHAAHRRKGRNLGNGIAHQPGDVEIRERSGAAPAATRRTRQKPG